ncbi:hypothetical protein JHK82_046587 [Glycine max]|uniref:Uncharacterized protein n=1 Tax=Glycine soja TaxID=3848 RepID=A0A445G209_GLYSO|nr:hypothetical protein JHK86_046486 [Glycine max]RZB55240.1 hypothetical protein D0Y65_044880 [Glycine soja]KAG4942391.1 hypothetical protein JHK85_047037 [Glycine max]KAG5096733.1 hypothetical protein JHK82_046587 [Glycine max]KAG5101526.1 hypothetical protein JHK84_046495 [Glycine max]
MAGAVSTVSGELKPSILDRVRAAPPPPDSSLLLATRPPRHLSPSLSFCFAPNLTLYHFTCSFILGQAVSYLTCSKLCAICFVAGAIFGYSLRGRVKRWASKILKKLS